MNLSELACGAQAKITGFSDGDKLSRHRLLSMGLTRGTIVKFIRKAPLGDPIEIELRGFHLALRKQEALVIDVELLEGETKESD